MSIQLSAQTVIGGTSPHPAAILDVQRHQKGVLFSRMTQEQRDLITNAASGPMIFNTTENRLQPNMGSPDTGHGYGNSIRRPGSLWHVHA